MSNQKYKPGPGWKHIGPSVYELGDIRIHLACALACRGMAGPRVFGDTWPTSKELARFVRINGGNRKRGIMAWARHWRSGIIDSPSTNTEIDHADTGS